MPAPPRSYGAVWIAAGAILIATAATLFIVPIVSCPDCEGSGLALDAAIDGTKEKCLRCDGKSRMSRLGIRTTKPQQTLVGAAGGADCSLYVGPLLAQEKIPFIANSAMHGIIEFHTDSPQNARRAREILEGDAREKGYGFWCPGRPNPWGAKK